MIFCFLFLLNVQRRFGSRGTSFALMPNGQPMVCFIETTVNTSNTVYHSTQSLPLLPLLTTNMKELQMILPIPSVDLHMQTTPLQKQQSFCTHIATSQWTRDAIHIYYASSYIEKNNQTIPPAHNKVVKHHSYLHKCVHAFKQRTHGSFRISFKSLRHFVTLSAAPHHT